VAPFSASSASGGMLVNWNEILRILDSGTNTPSDGQVRFSSVQRVFCLNHELDHLFSSTYFSEPRTELIVLVHMGSVLVQ
jgi:hypothetical protein